ncbi:hypothetical protein CS542_00840 [Pedobacter sp. IW39]|nr:hypothetical protein CS542_00840 [Pedobacter sp. IW39]
MFTIRRCKRSAPDTGIGVQDILYPLERIGKVTIDQAGFNFDVRIQQSKLITWASGRRSETLYHQSS